MFTGLMFFALFAQRNPNGDAAAAAAVGLIGMGMLCYLLFIIGAVLVNLLLFALWIWMLIDCIQSEQKMPESDNQLALWLLLIILIYPIGAIVYYFARRPYNKQGVYIDPSNDPFKPKGF